MVSQSLSSAESYTWQVIKKHYDEIPDLSISDLAELAHCSLSTINRTVRKKGFAGYAEFRFSIKEKPLPKISGFSKGVLAAIGKNEEELLRTINNISAEAIEEAVKEIDKATEIIIFAHGLSANAATEMMKKLQLFHKAVTLHDDYEYMAYYADFVKSGTLIIVLSLSGETLGIVKATEIAKLRGAKVLTLTVTKDSPLDKLADSSLVGYKSPLEVNYFDLDVHSRLPLYILVRVLFDAYSIYKKQA
ncbi:MAG: MurR/RpiR family transcriptional regulator [Streptococcaceae bacterium]|jgi:DNA-binding MurR/RpiR family transcriptional regulator|nr:MurR/RpiR family transcriptional regulator [Streptococcaceae bacterium]